jgi:hypothetical protein
MKKSDMLPIIFFCVFASSQAFAESSGGSVKGGDPRAQRFVSAARKAAEVVRKGAGNFSIDATALDRAIESTSVEMVQEELRLGKVKKSCLNTVSAAERNIRCTSGDIDALPDAPLGAFALHEYLGILGIEDGTYQLSYKLLGLKPEKFTCRVSFTEKWGDVSGTGGGRLTAEINETYDGGRSKRADALVITHEPNLGDDYLRFTWDLNPVGQSWAWEGSRPTKVIIRNSRLADPVQLDVSFGTVNGRYDSTDRNSVELGLLFLKKNGRRDGEGITTIPFPAPSYDLHVSTPGIKRAASVWCQAI